MIQGCKPILQRKKQLHQPHPHTRTANTRFTIQCDYGLSVLIVSTKMVAKVLIADTTRRNLIRFVDIDLIVG